MYSLALLVGAFAEATDRCLCQGVETVVRISQLSVNDENDPVYAMFVNTEISRAVMK